MKILAYDLPISHWERIAQQNGISLRSFHHRLNRYAPNIAATMPLKNTGKRPDPKSARQQSLAAGLPFWAITQYRRQHPNTTLTNAQIVTELTRQEPSTAAFLPWGGRRSERLKRRP